MESFCSEICCGIRELHGGEGLEESRSKRRSAGKGCECRVNFSYCYRYAVTPEEREITREITVETTGGRPWKYSKCTVDVQQGRKRTHVENLEGWADSEAAFGLHGGMHAGGERREAIGQVTTAGGRYGGKSYLFWMSIMIQFDYVFPSISVAVVGDVPWKKRKEKT